MNPLPDPADNSPLATLRQLKELLDAGAITPQEYDTLKQRLLFGAAPAEPAAPSAEAAAPANSSAPAAEVPPTPYLDTPAALTPEATPLLTPEPDWLAAAAPSLLTPANEADEEPGEVAERRNPLNLVFAIGGLLLFLGVVAYLTLGRPATPDEHLTSTSQTAADTTALAPEVGPQAEQLTLPPRTGPDTVRMVPAAAPPAAPATTAAPDSAATAPAAAPAAQAPAAATTPAPVAPKAAAPKPAVAPAPAATPADTAAGKP
ncbi:SHOCT domain-containing protein [Hymenobacter sp. RP-2-7]|uniref:SHOCT domain-containing protein n=1 Tax=Hymenobacter polaris TaxID=2682546 RepID=A0A7Y0FP70_9BACT|nr:SHOCT domain-containing protein [Hymenobacter polaris]NML67245.1 SHOCT domain-containing protein [Hymenobacter polaris]